MKQKIKDFIYRMDNVSFAEMTRQIPESAGERMMFINNDSLIVWSGVSQEFAEAVESLLREGLIRYEAVPGLVYVGDRQVLNGFPERFPLAKRVKRYKKPRWFPVVLRPPRKR
jgi:hypothetical protein